MCVLLFTVQAKTDSNHCISALSRVTAKYILEVEQQRKALEDEFLQLRESVGAPRYPNPIALPQPLPPEYDKTSVETATPHSNHLNDRRRTEGFKSGRKPSLQRSESRNLEKAKTKVSLVAGLSADQMLTALPVERMQELLIRDDISDLDIDSALDADFETERYIWKSLLRRYCLTASDPMPMVEEESKLLLTRIAALWTRLGLMLVKDAQKFDKEGNNIYFCT